jgi:hypothetical protein
MTRSTKLEIVIVTGILAVLGAVLLSQHRYDVDCAKEGGHVVYDMSLDLVRCERPGAPLPGAP